MARAAALDKRALALNRLDNSESAPTRPVARKLPLTEVPSALAGRMQRIGAVGVSQKPADVSDHTTDLSSQRTSATAESSQKAADGLSDHMADLDVADHTVDLGVSDHMQRLSQLATPVGVTADVAATLASALDKALASLLAHDHQQATKLQASVATLKDDFRGRLSRLEEEFVRKAEGLSDELARSVAACKEECTVAVAERADELAESLGRAKRVAAIQAGQADNKATRAVGSRPRPTDWHYDSD